MTDRGTMATEYERVLEAVDAIRGRVSVVPEVAVVLGSGLGAFVERLTDSVALPYGDLPHWPVPQVQGHAGRLVVGALGGRRVAALAGRVHAYEGHPPSRVAFAVRVLGVAGVKVVVLTNAAGAINPRFAPGALMVIDDHINLTGSSPLVGANDDRFGPRFPDMTHVYSPRLRALADEGGRALGLGLVHGVYAGVLGPGYETPAEIRYLQTIGADAVGMSTVAEAVAARHLGLEVLGISCLANAAAGVRPEPLSHAEVLAGTARAARGFAALLEDVVARL
jgi:purine-nucleoside phosphorylase